MITEVEKAFIVLHKMVEKKLEEKQKSGMVVNKGCEDEVKLSYKELLSILDSLQYHVVVREQIKNRGICKNCDYFSRDGYTENHGRCRLKSSKRYPVTNYGRCMGIYDNCAHNTSMEES